MPFRIFILLLLIIWTLVGEAKSPLCLQVPDLNNDEGHLTLRWNLEYTGADLAKVYADQKGHAKFGAALLDSSLPKYPHCSDSVISRPIFTKDLTAIEKIHGHMVSSVMAGPDGASSLSSGYHLIIEDTFRRGQHQFKEIDEARASKYGLKILNYSIAMDMYDEPTKQRLVQFSKLDQQGLILVASSGNRGATQPQVDQFIQEFPGIIVGAMTFRGKNWKASQSLGRRIIMAPGAQIIVPGVQEKLTVQDGTSFATPLVTGSLINVLKFLPELNRKSAENLIDITAVQLPQDAPAKMINAYKMVRVAERLTLLLQSKNFSTEEDKQKFINSTLSAGAILNFSEESQDLIRQAKNKQINDCDSLWAAIKLYRAAFLLTQSPETKQALITLYEKAGYNLNATFYRNI